MRTWNLYNSQRRGQNPVMTDLNEFHAFPLLPLELRRKIWLWSLPRPRVLSCCWAIPEPTALQVNAESREVALRHFEYIPQHSSTRRNDYHCIGHTHVCNYGYIDFSVDYLAKHSRITHQCIDKTPLKEKSRNLQTDDFEWNWAIEPAAFTPGRWVIRHLLLNYSNPVSKVLVLVHMDKMREIPLEERERIEEKTDIIGDVMVAGMRELRAMKDVEGSPKWKTWVVPEIEFRRCPCSREEGPLHYMTPICRINFEVDD
ncbi:hypothetical protein VTL71DRAFT_15766 [Oculimacula yallundae]|uniref:2EXR domain-containing protein n=1 Tax=Oculimacula yallundae TaxID=86028 RepID=A0ABR4CCL2_9HELO